MHLYRLYSFLATTSCSGTGGHNTRRLAGQADPCPPLSSAPPCFTYGGSRNNSIHVDNDNDSSPIKLSDDDDDDDEPIIIADDEAFPIPSRVGPVRAPSLRHLAKIATRLSSGVDGQVTMISGSFPHSPVSPVHQRPLDQPHHLLALAPDITYGASGDNPIDVDDYEDSPPIELSDDDERIILPDDEVFPGPPRRTSRLYVNWPRTLIACPRARELRAMRPS